MNTRIKINGKEISPEEVKSVMPKGLQVKDLWTVEMHYREHIKPDHYYNRKDHRAIRWMKESLVTEGIDSALDVVSDWFDCPPKEELKKTYDEIDQDYKAIYNSKEDFEKQWALERERSAVYDEVSKLVKGGEVKPGLFLEVELNGLYGKDDNVASDRICICHDFAFAEEDGDALAVYEQEILENPL